MRIGIDLDNTIIDYSNSFLHGVIDNHFFSQLKVNKILKDNISNKISIKELVKIEIHKFYNGEKKWQILQSKVYGDFIKFASINSEIYKFFTFSNINNFEIYIISHKTKYGHYDKSKKLLRLAALNFLKNKKIIAKNMINKKNIYFASTLDEKIKKISELKLDYFIDDLKKVLNHKKFPRKTKKIHFSPYLKRNTYNWININSYFFKKKDEVELINNYSALLLKNKKLKISKINEGGNSNLYKIKTNQYKEFVGKLYPFNNQPNIIVESSAINLLRISKVQKLNGKILIEKNKNFALYPFIDGKKPKKMNMQLLIQCVNFIKKIKNNCNKGFRYNASASCFSFSDIKDQIYNRFDLLKNNKNYNKKLNNFIQKDLKIEIPKIINYFEKKWPTDQYKKLSNKYKFLSPSDFGLHNSILKKNKLFFIDFEYFGWDDPVKLTADFILHPAMNLNHQQKKYWVHSLIELFKQDKNFLFRLKNSFYLYGIIWCLILLNEFLPHKSQNRNINLLRAREIKTIQNAQLNKSITLLKNIIKNYKKEFPYE